MNIINTKYVVVFVGFAIALAGCSSSNNTSNTSSVTAQTQGTSEQEAEVISAEVILDEAGITAAEVAEHKSVDDCWMIIESKVYNVSEYVRLHPGGAEIARGCGIDATELFATKGGKGKSHSAIADGTLNQFYIGDLAQ